MDYKTRAAFVKHVRDLEARCIAGDDDAAKSLCYMALLVEGFPPSGPDGGEVIDLAQYRSAA